MQKMYMILAFFLLMLASDIIRHSPWVAKTFPDCPIPVKRGDIVQFSNDSMFVVLREDTWSFPWCNFIEATNAKSIGKHHREIRENDLPNIKRIIRLSESEYRKNLNKIYPNGTPWWMKLPEA